MTDTTTQPASTSRPWFKRLAEILLREPHNVGELHELLHAAEEHGVLHPQALGMIEGVLQVSEIPVRDVMIPRTQMVALPLNASLAEIVPIVVTSSHSRFPVLGEKEDEIIGILLAKDLLAYHFQQHTDRFNLRSLLRPAVFIPESKRLDILLQEFRNSRQHMAIVVDEYGSPAGLVTIEDVLEQIVGEIADEYDLEEDAFIKPHADGQCTVKAATPIAEFNAYFKTDFSSSDFDTVGNLVLNSFGYLPKRQENITIENLQFKVLHADSKRIRLLNVKK